MHKLFVLLTFFLLSGFANVLHTMNVYSDELEEARDSTVPFKSASSYEQALHIWKSPEDINGWISANFSYDSARMIRLSESRRTKNEKFSIYSPSKFFETKTGVCVDLSRFSVETLRRIDPLSDPKYLMIEFDPIQIRGDLFRLHWLVSFKRDGKTYFFSDSKRPGHIAGPYKDTQAFVDEYAQYRGRKIVAFREVDSYKKQRRTKAMKRQAAEKPRRGGTNGR
jgi:hypothetical protein